MISLTPFLFVLAAMAPAAMIATFVILERDSDVRRSQVLSGAKSCRSGRRRGVTRDIAG